MDKIFKVAVVLTAIDRMSQSVKKAVDSSEAALKGMQQRSANLMASGGGYVAAGAAVTAALAPAVTAFADLEEAQLRLKASMMGPGGVVSELFPKVDELAQQLGNELPGTTADFYNMFEVMQSSGVSTQTILNGVGKAASYLAVSIKMPYEEAGKFAAKMKEATGVADAEMLAFMDTIARVKNLGVDSTEMQYAFGRSAGALKLMGIQGLEASKAMSNVYAQMIRAGMSGETVGTGFATIFNTILDPKKMAETNAAAAKLGISLEFMRDGKFLGVENMVAQFDKLRNLSADKRASVVNALTGGGADAQMLQTLITNGVAGFNKMNKTMAEQATLQQKVGSQLGGLKAMWEATTGTITNLMAAFGSGLAPALKPVVDMLGKAAGWLKTFLDENPRLTQFLAIMTAGVGVFLTVVGVVKLVQGAFIALRVVMMANPFILVATVAIMAISLIYANWDKIKAWFANLWQNVKQIFLNTWEWLKSLFLNYTPHGLIFKHWDKITAWFTDLWQKVKDIFNGFVNFMFTLHSRFYDAGVNIVKSIWEGIKAMAHKPVDEIKAMVTKIREFLPFSPAKVGPLKDIHRIKLVETIADSIKPASMMKAMQKTTQAVFDFRPQGVPSFAMAGAGGGGGVTVQMTINVGSGADGGAARGFIAELERNKSAIARIFEDIMEQKKRRSF